jgi:flagellar biosynthetic protein FliR
MHWIAQLNPEKFILFTLVFTRVTGLTMTAPIYGTRDVPMQVRVLFSLALALLLTPSQWHIDVEHPRTMLNYIAFIGGELMIGVCLGLGIMILFSGLQLAGALIGQVGGMMLAEIYDPTSEASVPIISRFMFLVSMAVFVTIGGHRIVMAGLLDTFASLPPGNAGLPTNVAEAFVVLIGESFQLGIRTAAPAVAALLLSTLVIGLIGRTLPQLNAIVLGFGLNAMVTFGSLALTLGAAAWAFQAYVEPGLDTMLGALIGTPAP